MKKYIVIILLSNLFLFCITTVFAKNSRKDLNSSIHIKYATVLGKERVQLKSDAGKKGATIGGLAGLYDAKGQSSRRKLEKSLIGASAGALIGGAVVGSKYAWSYTVEYFDGSQAKIITEQSELTHGDCVVIEEGKQTNIRRVSNYVCQEKMAEVHPEHIEDAAECDLAKEQLLKAETDDAVQLAVKKVRILCES